uniref:Uncharacterized protein n=1 Tax=Cacopsylla melanoneura TaxID=428564 RepID=A0A8D9BVL9_9HEMI
MTKKNKKGPKSTSSNEPAPSPSASQSSLSNQNNPPKVKNDSSVHRQSTPSTAQPSSSNQKPLKQNANITNKSKLNGQKGNANVNKSKVNGPNANTANKPKANAPPKKISLAPRAAELTPRDMKPLPAPRCIHAPVQFRLKCILLFKQECPMYCPENLETPPLNFFYKKYPSDMKAPQEMEIFKSVDQIVAANLKEPNSLNMILKIILLVLDNNNPLLINYDMVLYVLAKCLHMVRQDPKAKLPSPSIIDFRTKVLNLAVDRVCGQNSGRLLMFVLYMLSLSRKALQVEAVRKQLKHWYMTKESDQLLVIVAKHSSYQGLTHAMLLKEIHFDVTNQSTDKKLALFAIMFGFSYVAHRLTSGKFLDKPTVPKFVTESDVFDKGSDQVKAVIKDVAVARCPTSHQKAVAVVVKTHILGIQNVATRFHKSFKVNTACIEVMSRRALLQSMHRLRIENVLSSEPHAIVDTVSTADTYVRTLNAATAEPPLHPAEVLFAYAEYALVAKSKLASLMKKEEVQSQKTDSKDLPLPSKVPKAPEPAIITALNNLCQSSFAVMISFFLYSTNRSK